MLILAGLSLLVLQNSPEIKIAPDRSLSLEAYVELGMPAPDREWNSKDYVKAAAVMKKLAEDDACKLPRRDSTTSGKLWERICETQNLNLCLNPRLPVNDRMASGLELVQGMKDIFMTYSKPAPSGAVFDGEIIDSTAFMLKIMIVIFELAEEFRKSLSPDDPKKEAREKGAEKMRSGLAAQVQGALIMLGERDKWRVTHLLRLAGELKLSLPKLLHHLTPLSGKEIGVSIKRMIDEEQHPEMRASLKDLFTALPDAKPKE